MVCLLLLHTLFFATWISSVGETKSFLCHSFLAGTCSIPLMMLTNKSSTQIMPLNIPQSTYQNLLKFSRLAKTPHKKSSQSCNSQYITTQSWVLALYSQGFYPGQNKNYETFRGLFSLKCDFILYRCENLKLSQHFMLAMHEFKSCRAKVE